MQQTCERGEERYGVRHLATVLFALIRLVRAVWPSVALSEGSDAGQAVITSPASELALVLLAQFLLLVFALRTVACSITDVFPRDAHRVLVALEPMHAAVIALAKGDGLVLAVRAVPRAVAAVGVEDTLGGVGPALVVPRPALVVPAECLVLVSTDVRLPSPITQRAGPDTVSVIPRTLDEARFAHNRLLD